MKILGLGDVGNTGIGESLRLPLRHWHDSGHQISQAGLGFTGWADTLDESVYPWRHRMFNILGAQNDSERFGQKCMANIVAHVKPDVLMTAYDVWMVQYLAWPHRMLDANANIMLGLDQREFEHLAYFPLDGALRDGTLPREMDEVIAAFDHPVTYSRFARDVVKKSIGLEIPFIPIAHDPAIYHPGSREEARARLGLPQDKFIIGMVGTNQYRKLWWEFIEAAAALCRFHKDVMVLPWTTWDKQIAGGFDISHLIYQENIMSQAINPGAAIHQLSDERMADLYRSMDVCVLTTIGEGAGLPPLRARACGVPALVSANSSNTEFTAHGFERLRSIGTHYDNGSNILRYTTDVSQLVRKLTRLYDDRSFRDHLGALGVEEMRQYEIAAVMPQWDELLGSIK